MRLFGSVTYSWRGEVQTAHASPPSERSPQVVIQIDPRWLAVERRSNGAKLVDWTDVHELRGWAPVPAATQQDSASDALVQVSRGNDGSAGGERPMRCPTGGRNG